MYTSNLNIYFNCYFIFYVMTCHGFLCYNWLAGRKLQIHNQFLQKNCKQTTVDYRPTVDYKSAAQYRTFSTGTTGTTVVCCSLLQSAEEGPRFADEFYKLLVTTLFYNAFDTFFRS